MTPPIENDLFLEDDSTAQDTVMVELRRETAIELFYALAEELGIEVN